MTTPSESGTRPVGVRRALRAGVGFGVVAVGGGLLWPVAAAVVAHDVWRARRRRQTPGPSSLVARIAA